MLDNGGAALDEVPGIDVGKGAHRLDFCMVNMPANHSIKPLIIEGVDDALFIIRDELDSIFNLELDERRQGEMGLDP